MAKNSKETNDTHFFGVCLWQPKNGWNIGAVMRAVGCFDGSFVASSGSRYKEHRADFRNMDTEFARKRIPCFLDVPNVLDFVPHDSEIVVIERCDGSVPLPTFQHPRRATYIFGPEDGCVPTNEFGDRKFSSVHIPTSGSLNLAAACYITLYDRQLKSDCFNVNNVTCQRCGTTHVKEVSELTESGEMLYHCNACGHEWLESFV